MLEMYSCFVFVFSPQTFLTSTVCWSLQEVQVRAHLVVGVLCLLVVEASSLLVITSLGVEGRSLLLLKPTCPLASAINMIFHKTLHSPQTLNQQERLPAETVSDHHLPAHTLTSFDIRSI